MVEEVQGAGPAGVIAPHILSRVPGCESGEPPLSITALPAARFNRAFLVRTGRGRFVVRLNDSRSAEGFIDRRREVLLHTVAADARIAPRIFASDPAGGFLVLEYIDGRSWTEQSFSRLRELRELAARLQLLHELPVPAALPRIAVWDTLQTYASQVSARYPAERAVIDSMLNRASEALATSQTDKRAAGIVHLDINHTNLLVADRLYFLDWEYAGVGDPALDLASVMAYYPRTMTHAVLLLEATGLKAHGVTPLMLSELTRAFELMTYLWQRLPENESIAPLAGTQTLAQIERRLLGSA
jgi:thiamine kinase-like enzyme